MVSTTLIARSWNRRLEWPLVLDWRWPSHTIICYKHESVMVHLIRSFHLWCIRRILQHLHVGISFFLGILFEVRLNRHNSPLIPFFFLSHYHFQAKEVADLELAWLSLLLLESFLGLVVGQCLTPIEASFVANIPMWFVHLCSKLYQSLG